MSSEQRTHEPDLAPDDDAPHASARDDSTIEALSNDCLGAISRCETGKRGVVRESAMRTVAGVAASYASAGQHVAVKTISTLKKMTPKQLAKWELTARDLKNAERVCYGVRKIWNEATKDEGPATVAELRAKVEDKAMRLSRLDDGDLERLLRGAKMFQELRAAMNKAGGKARLARDKNERNALAKSFFESSPLPKQLGIREQDLRIYIRTGFGEDRAAWQRLALKKPPSGEGDDRLGARVKAAAEARHGWLLPSIDVDHALHAVLAEHPTASDVEVLRAVVTVHAQNPRPEYLQKAERYFRELRESRRAGEPWTIPNDPSRGDAQTAEPAARPSDPRVATPGAPAPTQPVSGKLKLESSVGRNAKNQPEDVHAVAVRLQKLGYLGKDFDTAQLVAAIRTFQTEGAGFKRSDGRVDPGGKTLRALDEASSAG